MKMLYQNIFGPKPTPLVMLYHVLIRPYLNKILDELWKDGEPNISYFKVFGCKCFTLITKENFCNLI